MRQEIKKLQAGLITLFSELSGIGSEKPDKKPGKKPGKPDKKPDKNNDTETDKEPAETKIQGNKDMPTSEDIAITGISGRFPKSPELEEFWENLLSGSDMISEIPKDRWDWQKCFGEPHGKENRTNSKWGGFLDDVKSFDAGFFRISPREAELMDPQQRLIMEEVWKMIEDAGYRPSSLSGTKTGIFIGASNNDYDELLGKGVRQDAYAATGSYFCIIPNRISYFLDLHGPSAAVDTACSASLVAMHQAVQAIQNGECTMAITGGVNLCLTPKKYFSFSHAGMLSPDGRCKTFDKRANGYVRAEGAGVVLLKPLSQAIADGDHIYGKIKGTAQNHNGHGGFEHAMTASNSQAQAELLISAYEDADIPPDTVTFIEAHGSATALGDPFEISGLKKAFSTLYTKKGKPVPKNPHCGIGSVKSNMGHAEPAAGIAGVLKILLAMKYKTIPANLHLNELNPIIRLKNSPFYMVTETAEWKQLQDEKGQPVPRRAGVSSFGFGGANAHVVIEEYDQLPPDSDHLSARELQIIVLSAKNEERLRAYARKLADFLKKSAKSSEYSLSAVAYTLQTGRDPMQERLAAVVSDTEELISELDQYCDGKNSTGVLYTGNVGKESKKTDMLVSGEAGEQFVTTVTKNREFSRLAQLWVSGIEPDWQLLYPQGTPNRIFLPTYPFAREHYWIPDSSVTADPCSGIGYADKIYPQTYPPLHPMVHRNTSDLSEQRFSSTFTGQEFFLADHMVHGERLLPGMAHLEMARAAVEAAVEKAAGVSEDGETGIRLKNVVWAGPVAAGDKPVQLHIGLFPEQSKEIAYEIYSTPEGGDAELTMHSQGTALLSLIREVPILDIEGVKSECGRRILSSDQCYETFRAMGTDYGPGYQGIEKVYEGSGQVLAKLSLPSSGPDMQPGTQDQFVLHPCLADSALQASVLMTRDMMQAAADTGSTAGLKPAQPFSLETLEIFGRCTKNMWASVRKNSSRAQKLDIDLSDENGKICVRIRGMEITENAEPVAEASLAAESQSVPVPKAHEVPEVMTFEEVWQEREISDTSLARIKTIKTLICFLSDPGNQQNAVKAMSGPEPGTEIIFISQGTAFRKESRKHYIVSSTDKKTYEQAFNAIREDYAEADAMLYLWTLEDKELIRDYTCFVLILQALASSGLKPGRLLVTGQTVNHLDRCHMESWIGFERSFSMVLPGTQIFVICKEAGKQAQKPSVREWTEILVAEIRAGIAGSVLYRDGKRHVCQVRQTTVQPGTGNILKPGGTYLITGGCGGLGLLFARHLAKTGSVNLILTGRSPLDKKKESEISLLKDSGTGIYYIQSDICDPIRMRQGLTRAKEHFKDTGGDIRGVIHAAGIEGGERIIEKDIRTFEKVLEPKIRGTLVLDELVREEPLDFVCYFSSSSAILGDFGSCDYAVANRFLTAYAAHRNQQQSRGRTVVISWPLWRDGGMGIGNAGDAEMYLKSSGQRFLEAEEGVALFDSLMMQNNTQHLVMAGKPSRVFRFLGLTEEPAEKPTEEPACSQPPVSPSPSGRGRRPEMRGFSADQCVEWDLKERVSKLLKISREHMDTDMNLAEFGFDSISLDEFASHLTELYEIEITPAIFFGYPTIEKLTGYFLTEHQEAIRAFYREPEDDRISQALPGQNAGPVPGIRVRRSGFALKRDYRPDPGPIAIIGMSGRFPKAGNIDEMWDILAQARDVVEEIPRDRFDWRRYYGKEPGKIVCNRSGFISGVAEFDPLFFEISPREAENMDPRQRLLIQESWKALEDAGYGEAMIRSGRIGMFVGVEQGDYQIMTKNDAGITSNHDAILAARLSYFLNLDGPAMAINTSCSSGLVAAHQACQSLRAGECDTAIAAGVNLMLTPKLYMAMSRAGMLSESGRCSAFDRRADGMVPGEAVAAVVLRPLSKALADGNPVYAVIRGSGINYDGKTNGITAPSGVAQTALLKSVYEKYHVNPEEITYVVTHGTGTRLGDPVEISALHDAFRDYTKKQGFCALTSVKTNFGHSFAASGLVSLIALAQAIRHKTIPASLHCEQENDYINWKESPFYVSKTTKAWPGNALGKRVGAVSAFGMSGTNAHMVVESGPRENSHGVRDQAPYFLLALSAKSSPALEEKIRDMTAVLEKNDPRYQDLSGISFTLLQGRRHFDRRCAIVIRDHEDAMHVLKKAGTGEKLPNLFHGTVPVNFTGQKVIRDYVQEIMEKSQSARENKNEYKETLYALADLYCQGYDIPGASLCGNSKPARISLPTYPFAREHYWVPGVSATGDTGSGMGYADKIHPIIYPMIHPMIHPMVHRNTSDLSEQRYSSAFTGEEFFLADHVVHGERILPGVAYLEMARAAVEKAAGVSEDGETRIRLRNVVWDRPAVAGEKPVQMHIRLLPRENGEIAWEIYTGDTDAELTVHSQGSALLSPCPEVPILDIKAVKSECDKMVLSSDQCYEAFRAMGIKHGPGHRGIEKVYAGPGRVLAKLSLPSSVSGTLADTVSDTQGQFVLHPSLTDSAFQASVLMARGLIQASADTSTGAGLKPALPSALEALEIFGRCTKNMWASVQKNNGRLDTDLCDESGNICVRIKGMEIEENAEPVAEASSQSPVTCRPAGKGRRPEMRGLGTDQCVEWDLKKHVSKLLGIPREHLDAEVNLAEFGFDSVSLAEFASVLTDFYGTEITPAIFFGYSTIEKLAGYFLTEHQETVRAFYQEAEKDETPRVLPKPVAAPGPVRRAGRSGFALKRNHGPGPGPIAIIGMSGRFPNARDTDEMWAILAQARDTVQEIPQDRFDWHQYSEKIVCNQGGFIPGVAEFDPLFFEISPREAEIMDPRQRLLLQESWKALEDAGYGETMIRTGRIGMFVGVEQGDYQTMSKSDPGITSNHDAILAARVSYFLNLDGPAMAINTACSSGLVAAHQACQSLRTGECDTAIAAGVNLMLTPGPYMAMSRAGMLSERGRCSAFDRQADGMVPGEAVAAVVLRPLSKALADGDPVYAVIRGSGINYDGKTNGITAPSGVAQTALLKSVYDRYQVNPEEISHVVTHGTGTKLGDPVEINALYDTFRDYTRKQGFCALTSVKTNFGHSFAASGLVSLIALVQAIRHKTIPASLHCEQENDYINWKESPFYVSKTGRPWPGEKRVGAVSAFGMSGTNAHMVVESGPRENSHNTALDQAPHFLLALSAKTSSALEEKIRDMTAVLEKNDLRDQDLPGVSFTLLHGRRHFDRRCAIVIRDCENAVHVLKQAGTGEKLPNLFHGTVPNNFTGQKAIRNYVQDLLEQSWSARGNKSKHKETLYALADLYCQGYDIPGANLCENGKPARISLPTYPFSREHYWIPGAPGTGDPGTGIGYADNTGPMTHPEIHPLVHRNASTLYEQKFVTCFTGREFYLKDHKKILTAMTYTEMARGAGKIAGDEEVRKIKNIIWAHPIKLEDQPREVRINLFPAEDKVEYRISTLTSANQEIVCSQGFLLYENEHASVPAEPEKIDIKSLRNICTHARTHEELYGDKMKMQFGPSFMCIKELFFNKTEALALLQLPSHLSDTPDAFGLHPSLMDGALQAGMFGLDPGVADRGTVIEFLEKGEAPLPFSLGEIEIVRQPLPKTCYAHAVLVKEGKDRTFNIQLADSSGRILVQLRNFMVRTVSRAGLDNIMPFSINNRVSELSPLLHRNVPGSHGHEFETLLTGKEFYLADHVVAGKKILPGVAYLEMARAAVEQTTGVSEDDQAKILLKNVVWARPVAVEDDPVSVHIRLFPEQDGETRYQISSHQGRENTEYSVHSQGTASVSRSDKVPVLDIRSLKAECDQKRLTSDECYEAFAKTGLEYGPGHRGIEKVYVGEGQVLAKLAIPPFVSDTADQFVLHPGLTDSALQSSGLVSGYLATATGPALPYALERLEIFGRCDSSVWAFARYSDNYSKGTVSGEKVRKFDIDLCNEDGRVCVLIRGFSARIPEPSHGTLILKPSWKEKAAGQEKQDKKKQDKEKDAADYDKHIVILCDTGQISETEIMEGIKGVQCITLQSGQEDIGKRFQTCAVQVFEQIKNILTDKPKARILIQTVISDENENQLFSGLSGLLKTAGLENSKLMGQVIQTGDFSDGIIKKLEQNSQHPEDKVIRYQGNKRLVAEFELSGDLQEEPAVPWKDKGVYLITGGAGGLGLIFAKEISEQVKNPVLILTGRSELSSDKEASLEELRSAGARAEYRESDVTEKTDIQNLIKNIAKEFGSLNGIIHAAGIISDNFVIRKSKEEFEKVLGPKVTGLVNLDDATRDLQPDFFVIFSSFAGAFGNAGQADYACANAFTDAYAAFRNDLAKTGKRRGKTLAVNWPLWKEGGMQADKETEKMIMQSSGMAPMQTDTGIKAFYQSFALNRSQVLVAEGNIEKMKQKLLSPPSAAPVRKISSSLADTSELSGNIRQMLIRNVSELMKIRADAVDPETELGKYGFDSLSFMEFANRLNQKYKLGLIPTLFFEYPTIESFAKYLADEHQGVFARKFAAKADSEISGTVTWEPENIASAKLAAKKLPLRFATAMPGKEHDTSVSEPVAIVGISGKFPMAEDTEEFWNNISEGKDCVTEIPGDRWDWRAIYGDPLQEANKTNIRWGGFIDGVGDFDPMFFGISPREAELMDPQQRLLMLCAWKAIEDSGNSPGSLSGTRTGIFVGTWSGSGYSDLISGAKLSFGTVPSAGPNRMSYFLNIHGPSEPIETACSSSLVAIHRAVEAMKSGNCDMAVAGGINTIITPDIHISASKAGMLSKDGKCKAFSDKADGFVRSEGVGMLFLKKLAHARQSGDHIYGVILGTAENHGGRASSPAAPNPKAEADLLKEAYTKAGTDPRTIGYIEAHGTGTELGDPIETDALKAAFKELYQATGSSDVVNAHCGLGSVKTNIGHAELAAGVAGVIKILLQLKHKTLVKSLHCDTVNPYVRLENSPFYIVKETREWKALHDSYGNELPRRAGVSSFGIGGANAHVVIEEYKEEGTEVQRHKSTKSEGPGIFVLSAKDEDRLKIYAENMADFLESENFKKDDPDLSDIAYTSQVGRDAMEERLALIAHSVEDLRDKLKSFAASQDNTEDFYQARVMRSKDDLADFASDEDMAKTIHAWLAKGKYAKLLGLWVKGLNFDWNRLYGEVKPRRISLPTYPFARERCWIPGSSGSGHQGTGIRYADKIHPLVHRNTSDFSEQRFSSTFTGEEFFLSDHVVHGERVLPGVAYLEIARAAVEKAAGIQGNGHIGIRLENVVWARPVVAGDKPVQLHIGLLPEESGEIAWEIYTESEPEPGNADAELTMHSQGTALLSTGLELPILDIKAVKSECGEVILSSDQCYETFSSVGVNYGPGHRGIEKVYAGSGRILAKLSLPCSVQYAQSGTQDQFVLHPSLMDSALQASGLMIGDMMQVAADIGIGDSLKSDLAESDLPKPALPFALEEIEIFGRCTQNMWASVQENNGASIQNRIQNRVQKFDIDLCDETGKICVRLKGFSSRVSDGESQTRSPAETFVGTVMLSPVWDTVQPEKGEIFPAPGERVLIVGGTDKSRNAVRQLCPKAQIPGIEPGDTVDAITRKLEESGSADHILWIGPRDSSESVTDDTLIEKQDQGVISVFRMIKALLGLGYGSRTLGWTLVTFQTQSVCKTDPANPAHASVHGLIGSVAKEYPNWKIRLADLEADCEPPFADIFTLPADPRGNALAYRDRQWHGLQLIPVRQSGSDHKLYRHGGVYVVVGGAGGIGEAWTEYMIRNYRAQVIWIGRREKDPAIQARLDSVAALGESPWYISADAADRDSLQQAYDEIKKRYSQVNGVIHSAIILSDQSLANMEEERFRAALSAKVDVSVRIAQVFQKESPDFVMFFSSMQTFDKAPGQGNYAAGCTFKDAFAHQLSREWSCAVKVMNWGYWGSVGIVASDAYRDRMAKAGFGSVEPPEAMEALEKLMAGPLDQVALMKTTKPVFMDVLNPKESIAFYPENFPSLAQSVQNRFSRAHSGDFR